MRTMNLYHKAIGIMVICILLSLLVQAAAADSNSITVTGVILRLEPRMQTSPPAPPQVLHRSRCSSPTILRVFWIRGAGTSGTGVSQPNRTRYTRSVRGCIRLP